MYPENECMRWYLYNNNVSRETSNRESEIQMYAVMLYKAKMFHVKHKSTIRNIDICDEIYKKTMLFVKDK